MIHTVFRKDTHSHFLSYIHELFVDLNKNCSEYTQGLIDYENVKLDIHCDQWRNYDVTFVWLKLEQVYSTQLAVIPRISFFASTGYLLVHRRGHIVYNVVQFKTIILTSNKFSFINLIELDHHWREIMLQKLNVVDNSCESTLVLKRKADILRISYDISIH